MTAPDDLPDLSRTAAALEAHDRAYAALHACYERASRNLGEAGRLLVSDKEIDRLAEEVDTLAAAVGAAYGEDTADRNDPATCAELVRPGAPTPPPGYEPTFVRRMVAAWRERAR